MKIKKKYSYSALFSLMFAVGIASFFVLPAIDFNRHQEYCTPTAIESSAPREPERTYIKKGGNYEIYQPSMHQDATTFYIKKGDVPIDQSNWKSQNMLCKLNTKHVLSDYLLFMVPSFLGIFLFLISVSFLTGITLQFLSPNMKGK